MDCNHGLEASLEVKISPSTNSFILKNSVSLTRLHSSVRLSNMKFRILASAWRSIFNAQTNCNECCRSRLTTSKTVGISLQTKRPLLSNPSLSSKTMAAQQSAWSSMGSLIDGWFRNQRKRETGTPSKDQSVSDIKNCDQCPVVMISWDDAQAFIQKLNQRTGKTYRLPSEAEWEYAAGAGSSSRTKWAGTSTESSLGTYAWYSANSDSKTHAVKSKSTNTLGIYDMSGNVGEWCQDWHGTYPTSSSAGYSDPATGPGRVIRSGGWNDSPVHCRATDRSYGSP